MAGSDLAVMWMLLWGAAMVFLLARHFSSERPSKSKQMPEPVSKQQTDSKSPPETFEQRKDRLVKNHHRNLSLIRTAISDRSEQKHAEDYERKRFTNAVRKLIDEE